MTKPSALERFRAAAAEREKEAKKREAEMKARHAQGKEDMKGAIDRLASSMKEEIDESDASWSASKEKEKENKLKSSDKDKLNAMRSMLAKEKKPVKESYEKAQQHKDDAESAKEVGDEHSYHMHMADHHGALADWHYSKGRNAAGDKHSGKAADHEMAAHALKKVKEEVELDEAMSSQQQMDFDRMLKGAMSRAAYNAKWKKKPKSDSKVIYGKNFKEEVVANNVGSGNIAGTQGDAGKKAVITKRPLKRFKEFDK